MGRTYSSYRAVVLLLIACWPAWAAAQGTASIAGTVKDATGAVLPGVTVVASSPALIERTRTAVTDGAGQYKIVSLPPGEYLVTLTLSGFSSLDREGIELATGFTATINGELRVGAVEETVVVSGAAPTVDVQNVRGQVVVTRDVVDALPTGKHYAALATLTPGVQYYNGSTAATDMGGAQGADSWPKLAAHGGRPSDTSVEINGLAVTSLDRNIGRTQMNLQDGAVQEFAIQFSGQSAEIETGGVTMSVIPKEGGNQFHGTASTYFSAPALQSSNFGDALRVRGVRAPDEIKTMWQVTPGVGGPIVRDRLWFFASGGRTVMERYKADAFFNQDIAAWRPVVDLSRRGYLSEKTKEINGRVTWQAAQKHKLAMSYLFNTVCQCPLAMGQFNTTFNSPEAAVVSPRTGHAAQLVWTAPMTNRWLVEGQVGYVRQLKRVGDGLVKPVAPSITESSNGWTFRAPMFFNTGYSQSTGIVPQGKASISYVTGTHAVKVGAQMRTGNFHSEVPNLVGNMTFTTLDYRPTSVSYYATPYGGVSEITQGGLFAQDQWTVQRLTLNMGLRYDYYTQGYSDVHLPAVQWVRQSRDFPGATIVRWKDLEPRLGAAYDVFGNGKTAVKGSLGRFAEQIGVLENPGTTKTSVVMTRRWTDPNGDFIIQGDPHIPEANGELGPSTNRRFGQPFVQDRYHESFAFGYGVRPFNWEASLALNHEIMPRVSLNVSYHRRWYGNFQVKDNLLVGPQDFSPYCVSSPKDARLPDGGGQQICGLYDLNPAKVGQVDTIILSSENFGKQQEHWNGVDITAQARIAGGAVLQGGVSTGKTMQDNCDVAPKLDDPSSRFCHTETPFITSVKGGGSYTFPWNIQVSGTVQSFSGPVVQANATFTNTQIASSLGRNLSSGATVRLPLLQPDSRYGDQFTQIDLRFGKEIRMGQWRIRGMVDIYNAFNISTITVVNTNYGTTGASWLVPQAIALPRIVRIGGQIDF